MKAYVFINISPRGRNNRLGAAKRRLSARCIVVASLWRQRKTAGAPWVGGSAVVGSFETPVGRRCIGGRFAQ
jgi:hypothetical protein